MSDKDKNSLPPEARRRGGMDTLFSAAWFDEDAKGGTPQGADRASDGPSGAKASAEAEADPPKKSNTALFVGLAVVGILLIGGAVCAGVVGAGAAWYYFSVVAVAGAAG